MKDTEEKPAITIRPISDISQMLAVEELQKEIWGCDDREVFPALALIPMVKVGAVLLGAFAGDELVGFVFGFPGFEHGQLILHSDLLAVKLAFRGHHLGLRLKLAQREEALKKGITKITWTFDPLQAVNAQLNFSKLGVTSDRYLINFYGQTTSFLHSTGSDRLWVSWQLDGQRVAQRLAGSLPERTTQRFKDSDVLLAVGDIGEPLVSPLSGKCSTATIEIPANFNYLLETDVALASQWRTASRRAFTHAIDEGFCVCEFQLNPGLRNCGAYVLSRNPVDVGIESLGDRLPIASRKNLLQM